MWAIWRELPNWFHMKQESRDYIPCDSKSQSVSGMLCLWKSEWQQRSDVTNLRQMIDTLNACTETAASIACVAAAQWSVPRASCIWMRSTPQPGAAHTQSPVIRYTDILQRLTKNSKKTRVLLFVTTEERFWLKTKNIPWNNTVQGCKRLRGLFVVLKSQTACWIVSILRACEVIL